MSEAYSSGQQSPETTEADIETTDQPEIITYGEGTRFYKPAGDVLHDPNVLPQNPGCEEVLLGLPYGECGGVKMTVEIVRIKSQDGKVYGNHEPTHGADSTNDSKVRGAEFGVEPEELSPGSIYVISAHGAAPSVVERATQRKLEIYKGVCPLVERIHRIVDEVVRRGDPDELIAYISFGKPDHPEVVGVKGAAEEGGKPFEIISGPEDADALIARLDAKAKVVVVGQTTNNSDLAGELALRIYEEGKKKGIEVSRQDSRDVCHTVRDRQNSTREIIQRGINKVVVVGSVNSKNTLSLAKVAAQEANLLGQPLEVWLVNSWSQLPSLEGPVGVVSGASTRAANVDGVINRLNSAQPTILVGEDTDRGVTFKPSDPAARQLFEGLAGRA